MDHSYSRCENKSYLPLLFCFIDNTLNGFYRFTGSIGQYQFNDDTFYEIYPCPPCAFACHYFFNPYIKASDFSVHWILYFAGQIQLVKVAWIAQVNALQTQNEHFKQQN